MWWKPFYLELSSIARLSNPTLLIKVIRKQEKCVSVGQKLNSSKEIQPILNLDVGQY
jgi:hypothetical protein